MQNLRIILFEAKAYPQNGALSGNSSMCFSLSLSLSVSLSDLGGVR